MRSVSSRTLMIDSRMLFWETTSPSCGATLNRNNRAPGCQALARMRTVAGDRSGVARFPDVHVEQERGVLENGARRADAINLDVARQPLAADSDGKYRQLLGFEAEQRVANRGVGGVRAIGDQHDARDGKPGQLFPDARQRRAEFCLGAVEP